MLPKTTPPNNEFRTPDLYLAAYLQTAGMVMKSTKRDPKSRKLQFIFDVSVGSIEDLRSGWFNGTGKVAAQPFANSIKTLKSLCHSEEDNNF